MEICGLNNEEKKAIEMLRNYDNEDNLHKIHQSINVVLNLIEKQQEEIEELKDESKEYQIGFAQGCYEKDLDWKDKIKAKIEEFEKQQKEEPDAYLCIKALSSLLEKE